MKKMVFFALLLSFKCTFLIAQIRLPAIIGDHMVLQQQSEVRLWGWCKPNEKIEIKTDWDTTVYRTVGTFDAEWSVFVKTPRAGGPYKITFTGNNSIVLNDVQIGEVWLCGGQSNMEMSVNWGLPYSKEAENANNKNIRFFYVPKTTASYPQLDVKSKWVVCNPEDMKNFSAVGYFFGEKLQQDLQVPIGLINDNWEGTAAETWTPAEVFETDTVLYTASQKLKPGFGWPSKPGCTYNAMISPITHFPIAGVIWYQGESNVNAYSSYKHLLTTMIGQWRKAWQKDFPFYYVEIAPFDWNNAGDANLNFLFRNMQRTILDYPKTGMVVITDLVDNTREIHPKMKKEVGLRLANYALSETYGKTGFAYKSPMYKTMEIEKVKIRIYFDNAEKGLISKGGAPNEFYIAAGDQHFLPAQAKIEGNTVVVWNKDIRNPVAVRFGFSNTATPNLFSKEGFPVNLFRTDNWKVDVSSDK